MPLGLFLLFIVVVLGYLVQFSGFRSAAKQMLISTSAKCKHYLRSFIACEQALRWGEIAKKIRRAEKVERGLGERTRLLPQSTLG